MGKRTIKVAMPDGTWLKASLPEPGVIEPSPTTRPPRNKGTPRNTGAAGYKRRAARRKGVNRYA